MLVFVFEWVSVFEFEYGSSCLFGLCRCLSRST